MNSGSDVVVQCSDADVVVILIYHIKRFSVKVWMDVCKNSYNSRQYIVITKLNESVVTMSEVLPAIHAFNGCDYMAAFMWKGKVKFYDKVESFEEY